MVFLDINTFFSPKAGGIRTYHQAKMAWFRGQADHRYVFVYPGPGFRSERTDSAVTLVEVYGPAMTRDPQGYRLLLDFPRIFRLIRKVKPRVLEAGDPWLTGLFCLLLKRLGLYKGLLVSFYHSDPVPSYLEPWASRGGGLFWKRMVVRLSARVFYLLQRGYDVTAVSSLAMQESLRARGVSRVVFMPFGVPSLFLEDPPPARLGVAIAGTGQAGEIRLLYAGRLDGEKGVDLLLEILPALLSLDNVRVTVAGRGSRAGRIAALRHPRFHYLGFLGAPADMKKLYDSQHILLAPGPYETFGLGVLEAMARGLVVVGPDQGGTGELLRQADSPFIFRAGDGEDFHRAAHAALACDWIRESGLSRELALRYGTWDQAVGRMTRQYLALAGD